MAGIENITGQILQEAREKASVMLRQAQDEADTVLRKAEEDTAAIRTQSEQKASDAAAAYAARVEAEAERKTRQALLGEKQAVICEVIRKAYERLSTEQKDAYFLMLEKLLQKNIRPETGVILFGQRDLSGMPVDFRDRIRDIAERAGGSLEIADEAADIENGFILRYGGIDENCSLQALFHAKEEILQDAVHETLWKMGESS
ncbi:MAG: Archaeal/vacuolar-type H+-ATPase subunit E [Eubacterium sp.]|nr:Archaeal/vacuolar-type H+-ATPase subunit E [Eubacterium sp.]